MYPFSPLIHFFNALLGEASMWKWKLTAILFPSVFRLVFGTISSSGKELFPHHFLSFLFLVHIRMLILRCWPGGQLQGMILTSAMKLYLNIMNIEMFLQTSLFIYKPQAFLQLPFRTNFVWSMLKLLTSSAECLSARVLLLLLYLRSSMSSSFFSLKFICKFSFFWAEFV